MDISKYEAHATKAEEHIKEAYEVLDLGVQGEISEVIALLCADTRLMYAEFEVQDARRKIARKMREIREDEDASV